jgi:MFS family permease
VLRIITGICMLGLYMVIESWLNEDSPQHVRGQEFAAYAMVTLLTMAVGIYAIIDHLSITSYAFSLVYGGLLFSIYALSAAHQRPLVTGRGARGDRGIGAGLCRGRNGRPYFSKPVHGCLQLEVRLFSLLVYRLSSLATACN